MPELPEVETVCRGLKLAVEGKTITRLELRRPDMRIPFPPDIGQITENQPIKSITRRAKYVLITLNSGNTLIAHLGMSGKLLYHPTPAEFRHHDHAIFHFKGGETVVFNDPRRFGLLTWTPEKSLNSHPFFHSQGPDPLEPACTPQYLECVLKNRKMPIKLAIMDQRLITGVGNIYACEALFHAKISPWLPSGEVTPKQIKTLLLILRTVLEEAITSGGSTLRDYVRSTGDSGYFQHHFTVYGREGKPCTTCEIPIQREVQGGRSTFFCPECQAAPALTA